MPLMRRNTAPFFKCAAAGLFACAWASLAVAAPQPAPRRPAAAGFPSPSGVPAVRPAPRPVAAPALAAPGVLPAALVGVEQYSVPSSRVRYDGPGVWDMDKASDAPDECFLVRWWANSANVDKAGLVLLLSYTLDSAPSRVLNLTRPLPSSVRGNQTASFTLPGPSARVFAWRAVILQRGRPLSILQSPDWNSAP